MNILRKALFLDRDGTLIRDVHYLKDPEKVEIIDEISESLLKVKNSGYLLFLHTNQSGIARGYYDWSDVDECNARMFENFGWPSDFFNEICIAPESPDEIEGYRKPSAKFEIEMTKKYNLEPAESWVVGDKWIDAQTGINARMRGGLVKTGKALDCKTRSLAKENKIPIHNHLGTLIESEIF